MKEEPMQSFILLDRSGSMATNWVETLGALNAFVKDVAKAEPKRKITLAAFDATHTQDEDFDVIRNKRAASEWIDVTEHEVMPRGMTPLFDAIGKLNGLVGDKKKATILILTDGMENASREISHEAARAIITNWNGRGYDVVFIGADFDAFAQAGSLGVGAGQTLNASKAAIGATMDVYSKRTMAYAAEGMVKGFSEEDRDRAAGKVKPASKTPA